MKYNVLIFIIYFLFFLSPLYSQETEQQEALSEIEESYLVSEETEEPQSKYSDAEIRRIEMEVKTSSLSELAVWCRMLGLSESGTREELAVRIREHFELPASAEESTENKKIITIESAQTTEYFSIDIVDEDYARLKGNVYITLKDGDTIHQISANEILFNRTRNIITAKGNVVYEKIDEDRTETFRGENITVNIDTWESVFLDGRSTIDSDGTAYLFSGLVISRTANDVTILRKAKVTSVNNENSLWSITASRLWLLPGSDFAIFNAWLKVGEIPVLYIPFFFFPTDELIFHPILGYRSREGGFVQTTTYILGRPKADSSQASSLSRILGNSNDMEKERHGMFLRSTGKKYVPTNEITLKALLDYYTNLGGYIGIDFSLPKKSILNPLELSFGLGFTRTVTDSGALGYTPYWPKYDGTSDWNKSNLFSLKVPFRYRLMTNSSISGKFGSLSWSFPFYSDPFVDSDFLNRSENMDWVNMLQQGAAVTENVTSESEIGAYQWHINGNINPTIPAILNPYISRVSITNISMTLGFKTFRDDDVFKNNPDAPNRFFYGPNNFTLYSISGSISGTPLSLGGERKRIIENIERDDPFKGIGVPISPWQKEYDAQEAAEQEKKISAAILSPPEIKQSFTLSRLGNTTFSINYQLSPTSSSELQFMNSKWKTFEDVKWNQIQSILTSIGGNASLDFRADHSAGLFSNVLSFTGTGTWRDYSYLNEEAYTNEIDGTVDEKKMEEARQQQYRQTFYSASYSYSGSVRPLINNHIFSQSNLQYTFRGTLVRSKRYIDGDGPELTPQWGKWAKEERIDGEDIIGLNTHQISANLAANVLNSNQNLSISVTLPPLDEMITTSATLRLWFSETNISYRVEKYKPQSGTSGQGEIELKNKNWLVKPIDIRETLRFGNFGSLTVSMTIEPEEEKKFSSLRASLSLWDLKINFLANKVVKSVFVPNDTERPYLGGKWVQEGEAAFHPRELSLAYAKAFKDINIYRNIVTFNITIDTSLTFNMQQYTNSNFTFSLGFTLKIAKILDITFSAKSDNSVIFRYFKNLPGMEKYTLMYPEGPQNNFFIDLFDSFNFVNAEKRRRSGFKMRSFNIDISHYLGDWTATFKLSMYPYQRSVAGEIPTINIISDFSFIVQWTPISEIKTERGYDGKNKRWTR